jgi:hypothetical protein
MKILCETFIGKLSDIGCKINVVLKPLELRVLRPENDF